MFVLIQRLREVLLSEVANRFELKCQSKQPLLLYYKICPCLRCNIPPPLDLSKICSILRMREGGKEGVRITNHRNRVNESPLKNLAFSLFMKMNTGFSRLFHEKKYGQKIAWQSIFHEVPFIILHERGFLHFQEFKEDVNKM